MIQKKTREQRLRSTKKWTDMSKIIREDNQFLCEVCRDNGVYTYDGLEVHHIKGLKEDPNGLLDRYNLICLCSKHHKQADAGEIDRAYLLKLAKKREDLLNG